MVDKKIVKTVAVPFHDFNFLVATKRLYMRVCPSDGRSVGRSVTSYFFGLLGATNAVYTALLIDFRL